MTKHDTIKQNIKPNKLINEMSLQGEAEFGVGYGLGILGGATLFAGHSWC